MTAATGPQLYTGNLAINKGLLGLCKGSGVFQGFEELRWVMDCTTNSCRSSVESIPSARFSVVDEFTDGEGHNVNFKMLAALLATELYSRRRGSNCVEFQALWF